MVGAAFMPTQNEVNLKITAFTAPGYLKWKAPLPPFFFFFIKNFTLNPKKKLHFPTCFA